RPGVIFLAVVVVWIMAAAADTLAFRRWASIGALAPGVTLFIWIAALAPGSAHPARAAATVAVTGAAFLALQHQVLQTRRRAAVGTPDPVPAPRQVAGGVALALVAALVAAVVTPWLPGAGADPLVDLRDDNRGSSTYQTSIPPLVDVADNLQRTERVELFTVQSSAPQYWRTVALDEYSADAGGQWTLRASGGDIDRGLDGTAPADAVRQQFRIGVLGERWMPAAFSPVAVNRADTLVVQDSLTLVTDRDSVSGLSYAVTSAPPPNDLTEAQRRATAAPIPSSLRVYTDLPGNVPHDVRALAQQITAGATNAYDKATRLRDYFRDGSFTYDPDVDLTDATDATVAFLQIKRGFCVQFASTYALMARAVGIPTRVAVGFTPGSLDPATGRYRVTNFEAHAWPEVWLPGIGWTNRFEPTPPSTAPGGSDLPGDTAASAVPAPITATPPTTLAPASGEAAPVTPTPGPGEPTPGASTDATGGGSRLPTALLAVLLALVLVGAVVAVVPTVKARRQARRRRRREPADRVAGAWEEAVDRLRELGEPRPVTATPAEVAARVDPVVGATAASSLAHLADAHTAAQFGAAPVTEAAADDAWHDFDRFRRALDGHLGFRRRFRARLSPLRDHAKVDASR
ncbi:MAG: transglutaminaseTgpA domain-containing protein, partial [Acidimicrobiia bacterium]